MRGWGAVLVLAIFSAAAVEGQPVDSVGFALGPVDAPVQVVEFADFACSACAEFAELTWSDVRARYVETGRIRWRVVPFELGFRNSDEGARAGYCAALEGRFWPMHDALFANRDAWADERRPREALTAIAASAGVDAERFVECYEDEDRTERAIDDANRAARDAGVRATPTFIVDGVPIQGALPFAAFSAVLERALAGGVVAGAR